MNYTLVAAVVLHYAQKWLGLSKETYTLTPRSNEGSLQVNVKVIEGLNDQDLSIKDANKEQHKKRAILQDKYITYPLISRNHQQTSAIETMIRGH